MSDDGARERQSELLHAAAAAAEGVRQALERHAQLCADVAAPSQDQLHAPEDALLEALHAYRRVAERWIRQSVLFAVELPEDPIGEGLHAHDEPEDLGELGDLIEIEASWVFEVADEAALLAQGLAAYDGSALPDAGVPVSQERRPLKALLGLFTRDVQWPTPGQHGYGVVLLGHQVSAGRVDDVDDEDDD